MNNSGRLELDCDASWSHVVRCAFWKYTSGDSIKGEKEFSASRSRDVIDGTAAIPRSTMVIA